MSLNSEQEKTRSGWEERGDHGGRPRASTRHWDTWKLQEIDVTQWKRGTENEVLKTNIYILIFS